MADMYDLVIIGGGPGGYNTGIRAGQRGLKIDKRLRRDRPEHRLHPVQGDAQRLRVL
jgi:thioredoxin reductase